MKVIVTDADDRRGLASVRNLGREGIYVAAAGSRRWDQAFFSKYRRERFIYPNPARDADAFAEFLLELVKARRFDCILPMSDYTTIPLSRHAEEFLKYTNLAVPDYQTLSLVRNKPEILKIAAGLGIDVPETHCPETVDEVRRISSALTYPCVVKFKKGTGAIGVRYPESPEEVISCFENPSRDGDVVFDDLTPMIQEYVPGGIHDVCVLFNRGQCRAAEVHQRVKMRPAVGGYGVRYETEDAPDLKAQGIRLLSEVGWHGPALVEFKVDEGTGRAVLMEVNTRFWGGIDVSAKAGINFAYLAAKMAVDGDVEPEWNYDVGMKYRWVEMEFTRALEGEDRFAKILDALTVERGAYTELALSDPLPHVVKASLALYRTARGLLRRNHG